MTNEERIKQNEARGYILVAAFDGHEIYKKDDQVGGWIYLSDKFSADKGALPIFHTTFVDKEELIAIAKDAYGLELK